MPSRRRIHLLLFVIILTAVPSAWPCSVPVFRYALEHWAADPFQITVFHRGALEDEQKAMLGTLQSDAVDVRPNAILRTIDLNEAAEAQRESLALSEKDASHEWHSVKVVHR